MEGAGTEVVVDTSVVVKFFVKETDSDKAGALLTSCLSGAVRLVTLDFLFIEFVNVLWLKTNQGSLTVEEAEEGIAHVVALSSQMEVVPSMAVAFLSFQASRHYAHAAYDAAFLALAESIGAPFVTADEKFYRKVQSRFRRAVLLRELRT